MRWEDSIQYIKGVGPQRAAKFEKLGIRTLGDLLELYPRGYIDYSNPVEIAAAPYDVACAVKAEVISTGALVRLPGGRTMFKVQCADESAGLAGHRG